MAALLHKCGFVYMLAEFHAGGGFRVPAERIQRNPEADIPGPKSAWLSGNRRPEWPGPPPMFPAQDAACQGQRGAVHAQTIKADHCGNRGDGARRRGGRHHCRHRCDCRHISHLVRHGPFRYRGGRQLPQRCAGQGARHPRRRVQSRRRRVSASHLPRNTDFDLFVIQVPNAPFGISWYQGDLESNRHGHARARSSGGSVSRPSPWRRAPRRLPGAQQPHPGRDGEPVVRPRAHLPPGPVVQLTEGRCRRGCPGATTPFNGDHTAGVQALSTRNFGDQTGPLRQLQP